MDAGARDGKCGVRRWRGNIYKWFVWSVQITTSSHVKSIFQPNLVSGGRKEHENDEENVRKMGVMMRWPGIKGE
jgi:hypothetical protein